jgi:hypothetical protein
MKGFGFLGHIVTALLLVAHAHALAQQTEHRDQTWYEEQYGRRELERIESKGKESNVKSQMSNIRGE